MTDFSNKRKADDFIEDPTDGGRVTAFELLSNILDEHIKSSNEHIKSSDERIERLEEENLDMRKEIIALTQKVDDCSKMDTFGEGHKQDDEDISDDEESVIDDTDPWEIMFRLLRDYRITNDHCKVSSSENPKLYNWVKNQKNSYNNAKTRKAGTHLKPERIIKLDSLGISWGQKYPTPASWDEMFNQLQKYQERMGNCNPPCNATNPTPLAKWVYYQRKEYKHFKRGRDSLITLDQIGTLQGIGLSWKGPKL